MLFQASFRLFFAPIPAILRQPIPRLEPLPLMSSTTQASTATGSPSTAFTTASAVIPSFSMTMFPGALSPNRSTPRPSRPARRTCTKGPTPPPRSPPCVGNSRATLSPGIPPADDRTGRTTASTPPASRPPASSPPQARAEARSRRQDDRLQFRGFCQRDVPALGDPLASSLHRDVVQVRQILPRQRQ